MRRIDEVKLFLKLCNLEYELLKYINRTQGEDAAPLNIFEAATALYITKADVRRALKRLVEAKALIADGEKFQISSEVLR